MHSYTCIHLQFVSCFCCCKKHCVVLSNVCVYIKIFLLALSSYLNCSKIERRILGSGFRSSQGTPCGQSAVIEFKGSILKIQVLVIERGTPEKSIFSQGFNQLQFQFAKEIS